MIKIAIFASGTGSNAACLMDYFIQQKREIEVAMVISNNPKAKVLEKAKERGISGRVFNNSDFANATAVVDYLKTEQISWIVLAGFLRKIPIEMIREFPNHIINIHPALLPKYGGKGMYGNHVHQAVVAAKEKESGISIHLINEIYDDGKILYQAKCKIQEEDDAEKVANNVLKLEHLHYPRIVEETILKSNEN